MAHMCDRHDRQATAPHGDVRFAESHQNRIRIAFYSCDDHSWRRVSHTAGIITAVEASVIQLVSSQLETRQSYSWYHHSCRGVSHTAGIITAGDASSSPLIAVEKASIREIS